MACTRKIYFDYIYIRRSAGDEITPSVSWLNDMATLLALTSTSIADAAADFIDSTVAAVTDVDYYIVTTANEGASITFTNGDELTLATGQKKLQDFEGACEIMEFDLTGWNNTTTSNGVNKVVNQSCPSLDIFMASTDSAKMILLFGVSGSALPTDFAAGSTPSITINVGTKTSDVSANFGFSDPTAV